MTSIQSPTLWRGFTFGGLIDRYCERTANIRPCRFLNLARFRCSTRRSDTELLAQEIVLWNRSMQFKRRFLYST